MIGTLVRWCGVGLVPTMSRNGLDSGTLVHYFIGALAHIMKNIERRQSAKDRNCRKGRGGGDRRVPIYIYILAYILYD